MLSFIPRVYSLAPYLFVLLCPFLDVELLNVVLLDVEFVLLDDNVAGTDVALTTVGLLFVSAFELACVVETFWLEDEILLGVVIFLGEEL